MKTCLIVSLLVIVSLFMVVGCDFKNNNSGIRTKENSTIDTNEKDNNSSEVISSVKVTINSKQYTIQLENNETVNSLINLLPLNLTMNDLNGNEKYIYLDNSLPTNSYSPKHINAGDVMLYGNNCLVIFYKSFDTSYSYTKIGHINNLPNLGSSNINVNITK